LSVDQRSAFVQMSKFISTNRLILVDGSMYEFFLSNVSFLLH